MQFSFPYLLPGEMPIDSLEAYDTARTALDAVERKKELLRQPRGKENPQLATEYDLARAEEERLRYSLYRRLPLVLISRCPFCNQPMWSGVSTFSLNDSFWYRGYSSGRDEVKPEFRCPHLFCVDGALNLNGYQPTEQFGAHVTHPEDIYMAAEIPFVKPRVLNLPTMVAVVHRFSVAEKYTAYPIVYFVEQAPDQHEFCIGWARTEYFDSIKGGNGFTISAKRSDKLDFGLDKWVRRNKLFWLDPNSEDHPLVKGLPDVFPFGSESGRENPYRISHGKIIELPYARDERPTYYMEDPWGPG